MKEINMYIRGICKNTQETKEGKYVAVLEYKGNNKIIKGQELYTTSNRMLLKALIEGTRQLKEPCKINIYTPTALGFKSKKTPNIDLIKLAIIEFENRGCKFNEIVSREKQEEMIKILQI